MEGKLRYRIREPEIEENELSPDGGEIVQWAVRWYCHYPVSYDLELRALPRKRFADLVLRVAER